MPVATRSNANVTSIEMLAPVTGSWRGVHEKVASDWQSLSQQRWSVRLSPPPIQRKVTEFRETEFSPLLARNVTPTFPVSKAVVRKITVLAQGTLPNPIPESGYTVPFVVRNGGLPPNIVAAAEEGSATHDRRIAGDWGHPPTATGARIKQM